MVKVWPGLCLAVIKICSNQSDMRFVPASDFSGSQNSADTILAALIMSSADYPSTLFTTRNFL